MVEENFKGKLVRSRLKWAGHVERMEGQRHMMRSEWRVEGKRKTESEIWQEWEGSGTRERLMGVRWSGRVAEKEQKSTTDILPSLP